MTNNTNKLTAYSQEINPLMRNIKLQQELLKDFKETDARCIKLVQVIKDAKDALNEYLEGNSIVDDIKSMKIELKEAVTAAAEGTEYKPAELKSYFSARIQDDGVTKVVKKGKLFVTLEEIIN